MLTAAEFLTATTVVDDLGCVDDVDEVLVGLVVSEAEEVVCGIGLGEGVVEVDTIKEDVSELGRTELLAVGGTESEGTTDLEGVTTGGTGIVGVVGGMILVRIGIGSPRRVDVVVTFLVGGTSCACRAASPRWLRTPRFSWIMIYRDIMQDLMGIDGA